MNGLEDGEPIRNQPLTPDAARRVNEFQFLTAKPVIAVVNAGEDLLDDVDAIQARLEAEVVRRRRAGNRSGRIPGRWNWRKCPQKTRRSSGNRSARANRGWIAWCACRIALLTK